jgi:hypothetical protein
MKYNLKYISKKSGKVVMGRRLPGFSRKIELSNGEIFSASWASNNLEYQGRYEPSGYFVEYEKPIFETITTPNGFKIAKQLSK